MARLGVSGACAAAVVLAVCVRATGASHPTATGVVVKSDGRPAVLQTTDGAAAPLRTVRLARIQQAVRAPTRFTRIVVHWGSQRLGARELLLVEDQFLVASALGEFRLPRKLVSKLEHDVGGNVVIHDSFDSLSDRWKTEGTPALSQERFASPPNSVRLKRTGQAIWIELGELPDALVKLNFYDPGGKLDGCQWSVRLAARDKSGVAADLGLDRSFYTARSLPRESQGFATPRSTGWHQLTLRCGTESWTVLIDGVVLMTTKTPSDGPLTLRVGVDKWKDSPSAQGVWIDDVVVARHAASQPAFLNLEDRDQVTGPDGDQWFGKILSVGPSGVEMEAATGAKHLLQWEQVRQACFAVRRTDPTVLNGEIGVVNSRDGGRLVAALQSADESEWRLRHDVFGEVSIPVTQIHSWRPLVAGFRIQLLCRSQRVGRSGSTYSFTRQQAGDAVLRLRVRDLEPSGPLAPFASLLRKGRLQTQVWLNGKKLDFLNRHLPDYSANAVEIVLPVPAASLKQENLLQIKQTPDPATGALDDVVIESMAFEQSTGGS